MTKNVLPALLLPLKKPALFLCFLHERLTDERDGILNEREQQYMLRPSIHWCTVSNCMSEHLSKATLSQETANYSCSVNVS